MPIIRRHTKLQKLEIHRDFGIFGKGCPLPNPNTTLPYTYGETFDFKLPKQIKGKRVYIGTVIALHRPRMIPDTSGTNGIFMTRTPTSGPVGFAVWLADYMSWCIAENSDSYYWYAWDADSKEETLVRYNSAQGKWDKNSQGEVSHTFLGMFIAPRAQQHYYWQNEHFRVWPDWLHALEAKAYRALYKAAEAQFNIRMPWGVYKGQFL